MLPKDLKQLLKKESINSTHWNYFRESFKSAQKARQLMKP